MDLALPEELVILQRTVRRFVDLELIPVETRSCTDGELRPDIRDRLQQRIKEIGLWMFDVPEQFGGLGLSLLGRAIVWQELGRTVALPVRDEAVTGPNVRAILYNLVGEMREKYLLPVLRGEKHACFAQTEADAGSDPGGMRTTAVRDGEFYIINGVKRFISSAGNADFMQLMVATDRNKGTRGGISCFIVDMDTPGVKLTTRYRTMMGDAPWEIVLDNVRVPAGNMVGEEGKGFALAQGWIGAGRVKHAARAVGVAERCLEMAAAYSKQRSTFGELLARRQGIQWMLADMYMEMERTRLLVYQAATSLDKGEEARVETYHAKYYADEMAFRAADTCMQIHGGLGLTTDLPIEQFWRRQRASRITEGASEVMRTVIARHVLKTYG